MFFSFNKTISLLILLIFLSLPTFVFAQGLKNAFNNDGPLTNIAQGGGYDATGGQDDQFQMARIAGIIVQIFLGTLGIIFIFLVVLGGYHWMTAQGEEEKVKKAQETIKRGVIGLIIIISAYAIWWFIYTNLLGIPANISSTG